MADSDTGDDAEFVETPECLCCGGDAEIPTTPAIITDGQEQAVPTICALCSGLLKANQNDLPDGACCVCADAWGGRTLRFDDRDVPICMVCVSSILNGRRGAVPTDPAARGERE